MESGSNSKRTESHASKRLSFFRNCPWGSRVTFVVVFSRASLWLLPRQSRARAGESLFLLLLRWTSAQAARLLARLPHNKSGPSPKHMRGWRDLNGPIGGAEEGGLDGRIVAPPAGIFTYQCVSVPRFEFPRFVYVCYPSAGFLLAAAPSSFFGPLPSDRFMHYFLPSLLAYALPTWPNSLHRIPHISIGYHLAARRYILVRALASISGSHLVFSKRFSFYSGCVIGLPPKSICYPLRRILPELINSGTSLFPSRLDFSVYHFGRSP